MYRFLKPLFLLIAFSVSGGSVACASPVLDGWAVNVDGLFVSFASFNTATAAQIPNKDVASTFDAGVIDNANGFGQVGPGGTGLGRLGIDVFGEGPHTVTALLDLHIDTGDFSFFDEFGSITGLPAAGLTWQIDDFYFGTIAQNVASGGALPNTNAFADPNVGDVSVALAYSFTVPHLQNGTRVNFNVGFSSGLPNLNPGLFYILQNSNDAAGTIFFSADLEPIPEPSDWLLIAGGLAAILAAKSCRRDAAVECSDK
jgi:hypothetical protein